MSNWQNAQIEEGAYWTSITKELNAPLALLEALTYYASGWEFAAHEIKRRQIGNALEVGVGPAGIGTLPFVLNDGQICGVDPLCPLEFECRNPLLNAYVQELRGRVHYRQTKGENLPFETGSYDLVASLNVLDHTENPSKILDEMYRVLRPGGLFLLGVNTFSVVGRWKFETWRKLQPSKAIFVMHPFSYRHSELKREMTCRGLRVLSEVGPKKPFLGKLMLSKFVAQKRGE